MLRRLQQTLWKSAPVALAIALVPSWAAGEVSGRVTDLGGRPVEGAQVRALVDDAAQDSTRTNAHGDFSLTPSAPLVLEVLHPDFEIRRVEVESSSDSSVTVVLERGSDTVREEIAVSASRTQGSFAAQSIASSVLTPEDSTGIPNAVGELVAEAPGVSQNGQGGLFQAYSVRGVSRQRVLTLVEGMRIVGERRAGVSASFLDPLLLGAVEVVRGPSSTYWGSGALGGVVQIFPRRFTETSVMAGYSTDGGERFVRAGQGGSGQSGPWSWGLAVRQAGSAETPAGEPLLSGFDQVSASFSRRWTHDRTTWDALVLSSQGNDIGKANTAFPEETTTYPEERHLLVHLAASRGSGWRFEGWAHPNDLVTRVESLGEGVNTVENRAFDWGVDAQREIQLGPDRTLRWGLDLVGRRDVRAREEDRDLAGNLVLQQETLSDASEQELGLYGALESTVGGIGTEGLTLLAGGRLALQRQDNPGFRRSEDSALTAFVGAVVPGPGGFEFTANLGTGLRFPSLSERFFTGTTGRGFVTGNPDLDPESSLSADVGLRWVGQTLFVSGSVFRTKVNEFIDRVETAPGSLTFVNLDSGRIRGLELDGAWQPASRWGLAFGGHAIEGRDEAGGPLADVPADSLYLGASFEHESWQWRARWEHRLAKNDAGSGEKAITAADIVSASVIWSWRPELGVRLSARNLLDEEYFNSADRRVPFAAGRSIGLAFDWRLPGG